MPVNVLIAMDELLAVLPHPLVVFVINRDGVFVGVAVVFGDAFIKGKGELIEGALNAAFAFNRALEQIASGDLFNDAASHVVFDLEELGNLWGIHPFAMLIHPFEQLVNSCAIFAWFHTFSSDMKNPHSRRGSRL